MVIDFILDFIARCIIPYASTIAALAACVGAIATFFIAWFNYRSRPVLIKSFEIHTGDIKEILSQWLMMIPVSSEPKDIGGLLYSLDPPGPTGVPVERHFLFEDLSNHEPKKMYVMNHWKKYKATLDEYNQKRFRIFWDILTQISKHTSLSYDPESQNGICPPAAKAVYTSFFKSVTGLHDSYWNQMIRDSTISPDGDGSVLLSREGILARGTEQEMKLTREILEKMIEDVPGFIGFNLYLEWSKRISELSKEKRELDDARHKLSHEIGDFKSIPIMTKKCKYIKGKF